MTFEEIVDAGRARALDFGVDWPSTARVLYRRIQIRQQELFSGANRVNPDYFGINVQGILSATFDVDLKVLEDPVASPTLDPTAAITRVEILDPGTSDYAQCDDVSIITPNDPDAACAPRMTLRNFILHGYKTDMAGVVSVCIYYGYRPQSLAEPILDSAVAELPEVYQELLVIDVCRFLLKMSIEMNPESKAAALAVLGEEITEMQQTFFSEVADYAGAQVSRFGSVVGTQRT